VARSVKVHEYEEKRNAILDVALRYISTKGYEQMTTQDILEDLQISRGAFYHYFDSKAALLFALAERMVNQLEELVLPIVHDPGIGAVEKLQRFFAAFDHLKLAHRSLVFAFMRVWYADENAIVRHKLYIARVKRLTPWLAEIIREGVEEGVFTTPYPDEAARMVFSLLEDVGYVIVEFLLEERELPDLSRMTRIVEATADALERILGVKPGSLQQAWSEALSQWRVPLSRMKEEDLVQASYSTKSEGRAL
jgi:AcrR family transcriptional regulator